MKSIAEIRCLKLPRMLKFTVSGKDFLTLSTLSAEINYSECYCYGVLYKKSLYECPVVSLTLLNSKITEIYCNYVKHNLVTIGLYQVEV